MKSENRKSSASGKAGKANAAPVADNTVADAEYASQLLAAAEALQPTAAAEPAEIANAVVVLPAQCVIRDAADLKQQLLKHLDATDAVQIDATNIERIDAAAMQVLVSFVLGRAKQQRNVEWCGINSVFSDAARTLGLDALLKLPALEQAA